MNSTAIKSSASCQYLQEGVPCELFRLHSEILLPLILATWPLCSAHDVSLKVSLPFRSEMKWRLNTGNLRFPIQGVLYQIRSYLAMNSYKSCELGDILIYLHNSLWCYILGETLDRPQKKSWIHMKMWFSQSSVRIKQWRKAFCSFHKRIYFTCINIPLLPLTSDLTFS